MTKIESRPQLGKPWEYDFIVDVEGDMNQEQYKYAMQAVRENCTFVEVFGCYKSIDVDAVQSVIRLNRHYKLPCNKSKCDECGTILLIVPHFISIIEAHCSYKVFRLGLHDRKQKSDCLQYFLSA